MQLDDVKHDDECCQNDNVKQDLGDIDVDVIVDWDFSDILFPVSLMFDQHDRDIHRNCRTFFTSTA